MRRARLLHSPETVEVLHIDTQAGIATIVRQGFQQRIPLSQIVLDEEESPLAQSQPSTIARQDTEIELLPRLLENKAELHLYHGHSTPSFYALYIHTPQKTWVPLLQRILSAGEAAFIAVSIESYPPPWKLLLQRLELPSDPVNTPPILHNAEIEVKLSAFMREGAQNLPLGKSSPAPVQQNSQKVELSQATALAPKSEIDLHIEKLAPELQNSPAEEIFSYQVQCMRRYLYACERAGQASVIVIHGVGKKRLQSALMEFCKAEGWRTEPLLIPPYLGGATRVHFS